MSHRHPPRHGPPEGSPLYARHKTCQVYVGCAASPFDLAHPITYRHNGPAPLRRNAGSASIPARPVSTFEFRILIAMTSPSNTQPPASRPDRRGGRRPGAGGKPGNLNSLPVLRRALGSGSLGSGFSVLGSWFFPPLPLLHLAARHRLKQRKAEQVAALLLNAMIERARSIAERQTINSNEAENPAPQIRPAPSKSADPAKPSNRTHNRQRTIRTQTRSSP